MARGGDDQRPRWKVVWKTDTENNQLSSPPFLWLPISILVSLWFSPYLLSLTPFTTLSSYFSFSFMSGFPHFVSLSTFFYPSFLLSFFYSPHSAPFAFLAFAIDPVRFSSEKKMSPHLFRLTYLVLFFIFFFPPRKKKFWKHISGPFWHLHPLKCVCL